MSLIKKFATVGGATTLSRVVGFVREALIGAALGAGPMADAFYAAFRFPNLFRRLFAEGAFNSAFIPLFAKELEGGGPEAARKFSEQVLSVLTAWLLFLSALAMITMPFLTRWVIAPGFADDPEKLDMTVLMTQIMFPYLLCMSLVAMLSGMLNSMRHYFLAAFVPILLNAGMIGALVISLGTDMNERDTGLLLSWGVLVSGFAQLGCLYWAVRRQGFGMRLRVPRLTPDVKKLLVLMGPAVLTGGVTQINLLVGQIIASSQEGAIALLNYADRINQLPLGIIGIAVGVVLLPELARSLKAGDHDDAQHLQNRSLEFALCLTLPAAVGFMLFAGPLVNIVYERGAFTPQTTELTAAALAAFATGLPAYVLIKVFSPAFFARLDMKSPMWFSIVAVVVNIVGSVALFPSYGHVGIAAATSIAAWVNFVLLAVVLWRRGDFRPSPETLRRIVFIVLASVAMGAVVLGLDAALASHVHNPSLGVRALTVLVIIGLAAIVYFAIVIATGAIDRDELLGALRRKRKPATGQAAPLEE
ncbi:murein biosynthesis integral membrane protein MurJ [Aquamicrobium zhengzhouense]|uniref:Probable lipid II flippase MurJ n=1 Tax=Aquamicrobium zhengzhouense TaxID=2781738 RepID=A0ABS0SHE0_9HYPH|nr:murein biosynthesis integral membrane protein MurJ [Aquamicrobium zhengzhouense]MBI1621833.1 murein biosynthesis integral membrane protein MurJ [Aquamicrobium zhengzhouense]